MTRYGLRGRERGGPRRATRPPLTPRPSRSRRSSPSRDRAATPPPSPKAPAGTPVHPLLGRARSRAQPRGDDAPTVGGPIHRRVSGAGHPLGGTPVTNRQVPALPPIAAATQMKFATLTMVTAGGVGRGTTNGTARRIPQRMSVSGRTADTKECVPQGRPAVRRPSHRPPPLERLLVPCRRGASANPRPCVGRGGACRRAHYAWVILPVAGHRGASVDLVLIAR